MSQLVNSYCNDCVVSHCAASRFYSTSGCSCPASLEVLLDDDIIMMSPDTLANLLQPVINVSVYHWAYNDRAPSYIIWYTIGPYQKPYRCH